MFLIKDRLDVWFQATNETRRGKDPPTEDGNTHPLQDWTRGTVEPGGTVGIEHTRMIRLH